MVARGGIPPSQSVYSSTILPDWEVIDAEIESVLAPTLFALTADDISTCEVGDVSPFL